MFNLEYAIAEWRRRMLAVGLSTPDPLEELESHLREEIERRTKAGLSEMEAFTAAVQKIGQAQVVQNEFKKVEETREARERKLVRTLAKAQVCLIALVLGCVEFFKIGFFVKTKLGVGLGLELPVALLVLVRSGLLNYKQMGGMRRYVIVWNLIMGALFTSPEVFTQVMMAVVLQALYEVGVWIAGYWDRQGTTAEGRKTI